MNSINEFFLMGMDRNIYDIYTPYNIQGPTINLGAGTKSIPGTIPLDLPEWDADIDPIPYHRDTIRQIHAFHFLEHLKDPVNMLQEIQRVLMPGGVVNIVVPYYNAQIAAQDLDHKHMFSEETWKTLFSNPYYNKNEIDWQFEIHVNFIMGIVERNLCLFTQLIKRP